MDCIPCTCVHVDFKNSNCLEIYVLEIEMPRVVKISSVIVLTDEIIQRTCLLTFRFVIIMVSMLWYNLGTDDGKMVQENAIH